MIVSRKRKKLSSTVGSPRSSPDTSAHGQELFKKHFEARFAPLPEPQKFYGKPAEDNDDADDPTHASDDSDWEGLSEEHTTEVEYVDTTELPLAGSESITRSRKSFMTSRAPESIPIEEEATPSTAKNNKDEHDDDAMHLKNDLALQRLLKESHLLEGTSMTSHSGRGRHKALDLRMQDLGSKASIFKQKTMPYAQRKGIASKTEEKERARRREALENGIVLEKESRVKKVRSDQRQRSIGGPSVGRFQGGTLKLSRKDVAEIQGPRKLPFKRR